MPNNFKDNNSHDDDTFLSSDDVGMPLNDNDDDLLGDIPSYEDIDIVTKTQHKEVKKDYNLDDFIIGHGFEVKDDTTTKPSTGANSGVKTAEAKSSADNGKGNKKTPKKKKSSPTSVILSWVAFVLITSVALSYLVATVVVDVLALDKDSTVVAVTLDENQSTYEVAKMLEDNGLVNHPLLFTVFAEVTNSDDEWKTGKYEVPRSAGYFGVSNRFKDQGVATEVVEVEIPRASTVQGIGTILNDAGVCTYDEFMEAEENYPFQFDFVEQIPTDKVTYRLEGYLYPDTYQFYKGSSAEVVITKMLENFESKIDESNLQFPVTVDGQTYTLHQMVTLGSIIEMECNGYDAEMENVSQVFHNRLNWEGQPKMLGSTPTADYVGGDAYDTNKIEGLPPGAVCNPTIDAIVAAAKPNREYEGYYYFVTDKEFKFYFNKTLEEHDSTIAKLKEDGMWATE